MRFLFLVFCMPPKKEPPPPVPFQTVTRSNSSTQTPHRVPVALVQGSPSVSRVPSPPVAIPGH